MDTGHRNPVSLYAVERGEQLGMDPIVVHQKSLRGKKGARQPPPLARSHSTACRCSHCSEIEIIGVSSSSMGYELAPPFRTSRRWAAARSMASAAFLRAALYAESSRKASNVRERQEGMPSIWGRSVPWRIGRKHPHALASRCGGGSTLKETTHACASDWGVRMVRAGCAGRRPVRLRPCQTLAPRCARVRTRCEPFLDVQKSTPSKVASMEHSEAIHGRLGVSDPAKSTHDSFDSRKVHFKTRSWPPVFARGAEPSNQI